VDEKRPKESFIQKKGWENLVCGSSVCRTDIKLKLQNSKINQWISEKTYKMEDWTEQSFCRI